MLRPRPARGGGAKHLGPGLVRGEGNLGKTPGHGCCILSKGLGGGVMSNHLLAVGPDPGSRQPRLR